MLTEFVMRDVKPDDVKWIKELMDKDWGGEPLIIRGKKYYPTALDGILVFDKEEKLKGFLFYDIQKTNCEIVVFEVFEKFKGLGTQILNRLKELARQKNCQRIYLMTHNDNLDALRFYQRRGFHICKIYLNSMEQLRKIKPCIAMVGDYGIPIRDEIDLEMDI